MVLEDRVQICGSYELRVKDRDPRALEKHESIR